MSLSWHTHAGWFVLLPSLGLRLADVCGWGSPNREQETERVSELQGGGLALAASTFPEKRRGALARVAGALTN